MNDITTNFGTLYHPFKGIILYRDNGGKNCYAEAYDMDSEGYPINAHPLTVKEGGLLAAALNASGEQKQDFLKPENLLPPNLLYINPGQNGYSVWYTPRQKVNLFFKDTLDIRCGRAEIPALLWKAGKEELSLFALRNTTAISAETILYHAPFFNIYEGGRVCMGSVAINISPDCMLEAFMAQWENYFFGSYFSHMIASVAPVKGNIVQLWQSLVDTRRKFPLRQLVKNGLTLKNVIQ